MRFEGYDDEIVDEDEVIDNVLGANPRAHELRLMRAALQQRLAVVRKEQALATDARAQADLNAKIVELEKQIAVLRQEEAITSFVEDSVRVTLHKPSSEELI